LCGTDVAASVAVDICFVFLFSYLLLSAHNILYLADAHDFVCGL
jgi:hypothetical protein